jgi:hypothetical protein
VTSLTLLGGQRHRNAYSPTSAYIAVLGVFEAALASPAEVNIIDSKRTPDRLKDAVVFPDRLKELIPKLSKQYYKRGHPPGDRTQLEQSKSVETQVALIKSTSKAVQMKSAQGGY